METTELKEIQTALPYFLKHRQCGYHTTMTQMYYIYTLKKQITLTILK